MKVSRAREGTKENTLDGRRRRRGGKGGRKRLGLFDSHKYRSNYAAANWKLNTLGVDGVRQRTRRGVVAGCFTRKESWLEGVGKFTSPSAGEEGDGSPREGVGWSAVGENDSEKLGSMRKESVKLAGTF